MQIDEILNQCKINGNIVTLPDVQLDRKTYLEVAKKIELIGGKWNKGAKGFVFKQDPSELFGAIKNGEKKDVKKEYQFFETPKELAEKLVSLIPKDIVRTVLEPSAGRGAIVRAINEEIPFADVSYCEFMELNRMQFIGDAKFLQDDFLSLSESFSFDAVTANPPFSKNQDIEHFMKMYLHADKIIISIMSNHWRNSTNKKETAFRDFLKGVDAEIIEIPQGAFRQSGTMVSACIVVVRK